MIKKPLVFLLITMCFSFSVKKKKAFLPPGTVQITEIFFADKNEITNFSWTEYEWWVADRFGYHSKEHLAVLPDTLVWKKHLESYCLVYYRQPAYRDYPVVGVSYEQALDFCRWRTDRVKKFYYIAHKKEINFEYRLPTRAEWELLSNNGSEVFNTKNYVKCVKNTKDSKVYQLHFHANCFINDSINGYTCTSPVSTYPKNLFSMYDMIGNVSEMIAEKGVAKGGSWINKLDDCRVGKDQRYLTPEAWLGFRCVCDVKP